MRKKILLVALMALVVGMLTPAAATAAEVTVNYGGLVLHSQAGVLQATHWNDVWDLTQGDLVLSYDLDMSQITQPAQWPIGVVWVEDPPGSDNWVALPYDPTPTTDPARYPDTYTPWVEVGLRGVGAPDFNPGPAFTYQGNCGGWMTSESDDWLGAYTIDPTTGEVLLVDDGTATQDGDDKHSLAATSGVGEWHYDVEDATGDVVYDSSWDSVEPMFGSHANHGLWYDRDGVDQWQATSWENSGINAGRINTQGKYHIVIRYHAINNGLGVMFATVNGVMQGFYKPAWHSGAMTGADRYPAGLSFKGDMQQMQVFAGIYSYDPAGWDYGHVTLSNLTVTGHVGVADPLLPDFTYTVGAGGAVSFNSSGTHGGMAPYSYAWDFGDGGTSTEANPTHTFSTPGPHQVTLTVTPYRCTPQSVTKEVGWGYIVVDKVTDPAGSSQSFQFAPSYGQGFSLTDASPPNSSGALHPGVYSVAELVPLPAGWSAGPATCDDGSSVSAIGLSPGETVTCTFTNTQVPGTSLTISKVANPADGTGFSFGGDLGAFTLASGESKTFGNLNPGEFEVTETLPAGWTLDDVVCTGPAGAVLDYDLAGETLSVTVVRGAAVSCTFTNTREGGGSLTVVKRTTPAGGAGFAFDGSFGPFSLDDGGVRVFDGLSAGEYTVVETPPAGWVFEDVACRTVPGAVVDYEVVGSGVVVNLAEGQDVICKFANREEDTGGPEGSLTIIKRTVPAGGTGFGFDAGALGSFTLGDGESQVFTDLAAGAYTVVETPAEGWEFASVECDALDYAVEGPSVTVNLAEGEAAVCTFTNGELPYTGDSLWLPVLLAGLATVLMGLGFWVAGLMRQTRA